MPNQANKGNGRSNAGQGQTGDPTRKADAPKANPERSDVKQGSPERGKRDDTSRTSNQGRKEASGGGNE